MRSLLLLMFLIPALSWAKQPADVDFAPVVGQIIASAEAAVAEYRPYMGTDTADRFSDLYFDQFEASGMEMAIALRDPSRKAALEARFNTLIGLANSGQPKPQLVAAWEALRSGLEQAAATQQLQTQGGDSFWTLLIQAFLILVREGFEAMLVVTALVSYLRRTGGEAQVGVVYHGVGWALLASAATAYAMSTLLQASGQTREALEGATMLVAAGLLFYVSYWLFAKREAARWQAYIRSQMDRALSRGSLFALGFTAFLAVFREGAETVLFFQALVGQTHNALGPVVLGGGAAAVVLVGLYLALRSASVRLPMGLFFGVTAALLYYLAVSFAGNGVVELQAAGMLPNTPLSGVPSIPWLGLHPSVESIAAQLALLLPGVLGLAWWLSQRHTPRTAQEAAK